MKINEKLFGKTFYSYTILTGLIKYGKVYYRCKCLECGRKFESRYDKIAKYELLVGCPKCSNKLRKTKYPKKKIEIGKVYGDLKVLENIGYIYPTNHDYYFKCQCIHCGGYKNIQSAHLKSSQDSCKCQHSSKGEKKIFNLLTDNKVPFFTEYIFPNYKNARYDFAIFDDTGKISHLIEYDGEGHYQDIEHFSNKYMERQEKDKQKNEFCFKWNYPLLRIPYWDYDVFTFDDIKDYKTSKYLVTPSIAA